MWAAPAKLELRLGPAVPWADGSRRTSLAFEQRVEENITLHRTAAVQLIEVTWTASTVWGPGPEARPMLGYRGTASAPWSWVALQGNGTERVTLASVPVAAVRITGKGTGGLVELGLYGAWALREGWGETAGVRNEGQSAGAALWAAKTADFGPLTCMAYCEQLGPCLCRSITYLEGYGCFPKQQMLTGHEPALNPNDKGFLSFFYLNYSAAGATSDKCSASEGGDVGPTSPPQDPASGWVPELIGGDQVVFVSRSALFSPPAVASFEARNVKSQAILAIDGDTSTHWLSQGSGSDHDWLQVEWGEVTPIHTVVIKWMWSPFFATEYDLQVRCTPRVLGNEKAGESAYVAPTAD